MAENKSEPAVATKPEEPAAPATPQEEKLWGLLSPALAGTVRIVFYLGTLVVTVSQTLGHPIAAGEHFSIELPPQLLYTLMIGVVVLLVLQIVDGIVHYYKFRYQISLWHTKWNKQAVKEVESQTELDAAREQAGIANEERAGRTAARKLAQSQENKSLKAPNAQEAQPAPSGADTGQPASALTSEPPTPINAPTGSKPI
jgi:hypothetical protein